MGQSGRNSTSRFEKIFTTLPLDTKETYEIQAPEVNGRIGSSQGAG